MARRASGRPEACLLHVEDRDARPAAVHDATYNFAVESGEKIGLVPAKAFRFVRTRHGHDVSADLRILGNSLSDRFPPERMPTTGDLEGAGSPSFSCFFSPATRSSVKSCSMLTDCNRAPERVTLSLPASGLGRGARPQPHPMAPQLFKIPAQLEQTLTSASSSDLCAATPSHIYPFTGRLRSRLADLHTSCKCSDICC